MDEAPRTRSRSIRALGRLAPPKVEDVLLAQWAGGPSDKAFLDDIALSTDWAGKPESPAACLNCTPLPPAHHKATLKAFECHLGDSVNRLLEAIDADVSGGQRMPLSYEAPPVTKDDAFDAITALSIAGEMTVRRAGNRRKKLTDPVRSIGTPVGAGRSLPVGAHHRRRALPQTGRDRQPAQLARHNDATVVSGTRTGVICRSGFRVRMPTPVSGSRKSAPRRCRSSLR